jgi:hypothetical protein
MAGGGGRWEGRRKGRRKERRKGRRKGRRGRPTLTPSTRPFLVFLARTKVEARRLAMRALFSECCSCSHAKEGGGSPT